MVQEEPYKGDYSDHCDDVLAAGTPSEWTRTQHDGAVVLAVDDDCMPMALCNPPMVCVMRMGMLHFDDSEISK